MQYKKIIPCLDVMNGRVVKGVKFVGLKDAGDPAECARAYSEQGADEIVFLDINATHENRGTLLSVVRRTAECVTVPLTVGGGITSVEDIRAVLDAGANKVSINSAAVRSPELLSRAADEFGSCSVVLALDVRRADSGRYNVLVRGGREDTGIDAAEWALQAEKLGAGEILLTSMDADGTKDGYDLEITRIIAELVKIPVTASGGCGSLQHFADVFNRTKASAALAASLFHFGELTVPQVKEYLKSKNISVRI